MPIVESEVPLHDLRQLEIKKKFFDYFRDTFIFVRQDVSRPWKMRKLVFYDFDSDTGKECWHCRDENNRMSPHVKWLYGKPTAAKEDDWPHALEGDIEAITGESLKPEPSETEQPEPKDPPKSLDRAGDIIAGIFAVLVAAGVFIVLPCSCCYKWGYQTCEKKEVKLWRQEFCAADRQLDILKEQCRTLKGGDSFYGENKPYHYISLDGDKTWWRVVWDPEVSVGCEVQKLVALEPAPKDHVDYILDREYIIRQLNKHTDSPSEARQALRALEASLIKHRNIQLPEAQTALGVDAE